MKEGWEKKPLLSFAEVCTGKHDANYATLNGKYRFYTCAYEYMWCDNYRFDEECLILPGNGANVGEVFYYNGPFDAYQRTYVVYKIRDILPKCLYYHFLYNWKTVGVSAQYGAATNYIKIGNFIDYKVNIPPPYEQSRIVEELDQLSNIIEKKRQQLSELDNLAQSIFYDMFGDPVTNEKGWEVKKLGEVCEPKSKIIRANKQYLSKDKIRYIDISSIDNSCNTITYTNVMNFGDAPSRAQQIVLIGDVLVSLVRPNLRNIALISYDYDDLVASTGFCVLRTIEIINSYYLLYCVLGENFTDYLMERTSGANYPAVREEDIKGYDMCIPPLSLQQLFAQKSEAIEKENELIKQSIKETEELFNSRMDYYFG